jgi:5-methylcytosine-specific restriction endonuclease McrA
MSNEDIFQLYNKHGSITKLLSEHFDVKRDSRIRNLVSTKITEHTGSNIHSLRHSAKAALTVDSVTSLATTCSSLTTLIVALGLQPIGSNFTRVSSFISKHNIQLCPKEKSSNFSDDQVYIQNSLYKRGQLSQRVRRDGWLPYVCSVCNNGGNWMNTSLTLHIDHINGVNTDHRKENLRWLCPNCHSQTPTYGGKNNKK